MTSKQLILTGGAVIILAAGCNKSPVATTSNATPQAAPQPVAATHLQQNSPNQTETANWETYTNDRYGFAVKYPSGYDSSLSPSNKDPIPCNSQYAASKELRLIIWNTDYWNADRAANPTLAARNGIGDFDIYIQDPNDHCAVTYHSNGPGGPTAKLIRNNTLVSSGNVLINGYNVLKRTYQVTDANEQGNPIAYTYSTWRFEKNGLYITLTYNGEYRNYDQQTEGSALFQTFLSTFTFTK